LLNQIESINTHNKYTAYDPGQGGSYGVLSYNCSLDKAADFLSKRIWQRLLAATLSFLVTELYICVGHTATQLRSPILAFLADSCGHVTNFGHEI
jgi:hypothetical protein